MIVSKFFFELPFEAKGKRSVMGSKGIFYTDSKTRKFMKDVAFIASGALGNAYIKSPVTLRICAIFKRPKYLQKVYVRSGKPKHSPGYLPHTAKPDTDNITKGIKDALKRWIPEDSVVWDEHCMKLYGRLIKDNSGQWVPEESKVLVSIEQHSAKMVVEMEKIING